MNALSLCAKHRRMKRIAPPLGCNICRRIGIERRVAYETSLVPISVTIVLRTVDVLLAAGYLLNVNDGEFNRPLIPTRDKAVMFRELMDTDMEAIEVYDEVSNLHPMGWVQFVYGNDGYDVISNYTTNLEQVLKPINDWVDSEVAP